MARATKENLIDQPSEDLIDLADSRISGDAIADYGGTYDVAPAPRSGLFAAFSSLPFILGGLGLSMIVVVWLLFIDGQRSEQEARYIEQSSQLLMLSQRIAKDAREAVSGEPGAFKTLKQSRDL